MSMSDILAAFLLLLVPLRHRKANRRIIIIIIIILVLIWFRYSEHDDAIWQTLILININMVQIL